MPGRTLDSSRLFPLPGVSADCALPSLGGPDWNYLQGLAVHEKESIAPNFPFGLDGVHPLRILSISGWPSYPSSKSLPFPCPTPWSRPRIRCSYLSTPGNRLINRYGEAVKEIPLFLIGEGLRAHDSMLPASPPFYPLLNEAADLPSLLALPDSPGRGFYEATRWFVESGNAVIRLWLDRKPIPACARTVSFDSFWSYCRSRSWWKTYCMRSTSLVIPFFFFCLNPYPLLQVSLSGIQGRWK